MPSPAFPSSRTRPAHAQARTDPPRRIDLEPREPLHRLDRRGPHAHRRGAGPRAGRLLKAEGFEFDVAYTSVLKRAIWTLWHALDEMDRMWLPVVNDWRLNERHYGALQGLNKAETAQAVRRRAGAGLAPQLRHAAAGARAGRSAHASAATRATRSSPPGEVPLTECLKDTVARVLPYWNDSARAGDPRRPARADRRARQQHARAGEVPRRHLRRRHRRPEHPQRHPAGLRAGRRACKPIRSYYLGDAEAAAKAAAAVANQGKA